MYYIGHKFKLQCLFLCPWLCLDQWNYRTYFWQDKELNVNALCKTWHFLELVHPLLFFTLNHHNTILWLKNMATINRRWLKTYKPWKDFCCWVLEKDMLNLRLKNLKLFLVYLVEPMKYALVSWEIPPGRMIGNLYKNWFGVCKND